MPEVAARPLWTCVRGHVITDFDREVESVCLDGKLNLDVCREHQTPLLVQAVDTTHNPIVGPDP